MCGINCSANGCLTFFITQKEEAPHLVFSKKPHMDTSFSSLTPFLPASFSLEVSSSTTELALQSSLLSQDIPRLLTNN